MTRGPSSQKVQKIYEQIFSGKHYIYPKLAPGIVVISSLIVWVMGAYTEIVPAAAVTSKYYITGVLINNPDANIEYVVDIAFGAAGLEVDQGTVSFKVDNANNNINYPFVVPIAAPPGTRVSARCAANAIGAHTCGVKLKYKS